ncbi:BCCT family transporter [Corynebacterium zhongnanshanii]|uniref:BCCT family transporter n=1 Tax=Corynebacterium zhongnanshanii TaxID=2768834 RepID=A0ABQ6VF80_9CORY|nr:BCCT family transporter [Corynebacterium zhongnanshanii]KAB3523054.1 BCCT family transporter [Corynebacterium zhongnanshanii]
MTVSQEKGSSSPKKLDHTESGTPDVNPQGQDVDTDDTVQLDENASINMSVTIPAAGLILAVLLWALFSKDSFSSFSSAALDYLVSDWGWLFVLVGSLFVAFILFIAFSRFGHIRLGKDNESPEFSTPSWVAMMFAAGMGIGLMFYGVTEPLTFYRDGVPGSETEDVSTALSTTLFHWGLHPWSLYAIVGLAIAYTTYRLGRKQLLSAAFAPLIGEKRATGAIGKAIDVLAIFATVFGTAASLGVGATQIASGMDSVGILHNPGTWTLVGIIVVLSIFFLASAASGVGKGIQYVSNFNMVTAAILALFVLIVGPTVVILNLVPTTLGSYLQNFFVNASRTANSSHDASSWLSSWTIFYWAWWTSWSPFVGMFLARISRGRTIREFVIVVLTVPTLVTIVWFSIFGGSAMHLEEIGQSIWGDGDPTKQLFSLLDTMPLGQISSIIAMILLATFFITSADSASTVMGTMSQHGREVASPVVSVLWGALTALIAVVLLTTGGDDSLSNLQTITIVAASPFTLIIIALMFAIPKALSDDPLYLDQKAQRQFALRVAKERRVNEQRRQNTRKRLGKQHGPSAAPGEGNGSAAVAAATAEAASNKHEVFDGNEVVEVVKVSDIEHIVEAAQQAARDAQEASDAYIEYAETHDIDPNPSSDSEKK